MLILEPMLAKPIEPDRIDQHRHWLMEPKLDGVRCVAIKIDGDLTLISRGNKILTDKVPQSILDTLQRIPTNFILDGELGYRKCTTTRSYRRVGHGIENWTTIDFNMTMRVIGSGPYTAQEKIAENNRNGMSMTYTVFDILDRDLHEGVASIPFKDRSNALEDFFATFIPYEAPVKLIPQVYQFDDSLWTQYVEEGGEGVILKNPDGIYYPGKRKAGTWGKLKTFFEADVVIDSEYLPGQGKYEGQVGALYFGAHAQIEGTGLWQFVRLGKCSGMSDAERLEFTQNFDHYKGKVMTIKHFGFVGEDGRGLRHPNFSRLRPDKIATECLVEDVFS